MAERTNSLKLIRWVLWGAVVLAGMAFFVLSSRTPTLKSTSLPGEVKIGSPFQLTSHTGETFDSKSLAGKPYLIFFGFTHCPDICPTTLLDLTNQLKDLGPRAKQINTLFISVDPERDTPENLKKYLESFGENIIGLTGKPDQIKKVASSFRAVYERVPGGQDGDANDYSMNHTATVFMMDRNGRFAGTLSFQEKPEVRRKKLNRLLASP
ncbi:MAG: SCO family protein [Hyphomicrobiaceae bacterium]